MFKRFIVSVLLIGFVFSAFHDFVFYKVDPCMDSIKSLEIFGVKDLSPDDPFCDLHQELHTEYTLSNSTEIKPALFIDIKNPISKSLNPQEIVNLLFKPPTVS